MKRNVLFLILVFISFLSIKSQTWQWAKSCINDAYGFGDANSVSADPFGNVFSTGSYASQIVAGTVTLNSGSAYLIKYDSNGNVLWAKSSIATLPSGDSDLPYSVCSDSLGNALVAGSFNWSTSFGTCTLTGTSPYSSMFLVKYDVNGNVLWARTPTDTVGSRAYSVSCDANNNIFVAGTFYGPTIAFGTYTLTGVDSINFFITKYDPNGNVLWAKTAKGNITGYIWGGDVSISTESNGNSFVTGSFMSPTMTFGSYTLTNSGYVDVFVAKYDPNGNVLWASNPTGIGPEAAYSVSSDNIGNAYVTGEYYSPSIVFGTYTLTGGFNFFLAKYDSNGNVLWVKNSIGGDMQTGQYSSVSSNTGGAFVMGNMAINGSTLALGNYTLSPPVGYVDPIFIAHYDFNGNINYAISLAGGADDWKSVCCDRYCNAYITADFGSNPIVIGPQTLNPTGPGENAFTAKLSFATNRCQGFPEGQKILSELQDKFVLFPNPNSGSCKLLIEETIKEGELTILNSIGQKAHEQQIFRGVNEININLLKNGLYYYLIRQNNQTIKTGKIVKE